MCMCMCMCMCMSLYSTNPTFDSPHSMPCIETNTCAYTCPYTYTHTHTHTHTHIHIHTHHHAGAQERKKRADAREVHVHVHAPVPVCVCACVCVRARVCVCVCVCVCVNMVFVLQPSSVIVLPHGACFTTLALCESCVPHCKQESGSVYRVLVFPRRFERVLLWCQRSHVHTAEKAGHNCSCQYSHERHLTTGATSRATSNYWC